MNYYKSIKKRAYTFVIYIGMHQWDTQPMLYIGGVCPKKVGVYDLVDVNVVYRFGVFPMNYQHTLMGKSRPTELNHLIEFLSIDVYITCVSL